MRRPPLPWPCLATALMLAGLSCDAQTRAGPPCGSCDAERLALNPDKRPDAVRVNWTSPAQMAAWDQRQFSAQSPDAFEAEYSRVRDWCDAEPSRWTQPKPLIEHTVEHMRAHYGFPCAREGGFCRCMGRVIYGRQEGVSTLAALLRHNHTYKDVASPLLGACCGKCGNMVDPEPRARKACFCSVHSTRGFAYAAAWMRPLILRQPSKPQARVCKTPSRRDGWGRAEQTFITRVGPVSTNRDDYYNRGLQGDVQLSLIPAIPKTGTVYVTESIDYYYDAAKGAKHGWLAFPPVHPHHSTSMFVGYEQAITKYGAGPFADWWPWAAMSTADAARGRASEASSNSPGFNVDLLDCRGAQEVGCSYLKLPPHLGWPVFNGTDLWSGSWANTMAKKAGGVAPPEEMYIEYGRKVVWPEESSSTAQARPEVGGRAKMRPVWTLDFAANGRGITFTNKGSAKGKLGSVAWHTYTMPVAGRAVASWYHTHSHAASEMWVIAGDVEPYIPEDIVLRAKANSSDKAYVTFKGSRGTYLTPPMLFDDDGRANRYTMAQLQERILLRLPAGSLRCQYKSRNEYVKDAFFAREAARSHATAATCDDYAFEQYDEISLLVFNYPYTGAQQALFGGGELIEQHNRWFAVMELEMPAWWNPEAAGSGLPLDSMTSQKATFQPKVAKTKVEIMGEVVYEPPAHYLNGEKISAAKPLSISELIGMILYRYVRSSREDSNSPADAATLAGATHAAAAATHTRTWTDPF